MVRLIIISILLLLLAPFWPATDAGADTADRFQPSCDITTQPKQIEETLWPQDCEQMARKVSVARHFVANCVDAPLDILRQAARHLIQFQEGKHVALTDYAATAKRLSEHQKFLTNPVAYLAGCLPGAFVSAEKVRFSQHQAILNDVKKLKAAIDRMTKLHAMASGIDSSKLTQENLKKFRPKPEDIKQARSTYELAVAVKNDIRSLAEKFFDFVFDLDESSSSVQQSIGKTAQLLGQGGQCLIGKADAEAKRALMLAADALLNASRKRNYYSKDLRCRTDKKTEKLFWNLTQTQAQWNRSIRDQINTIEYWDNSVKDLRELYRNAQNVCKRVHLVNKRVEEDTEKSRKLAVQAKALIKKCDLDGASRVVDQLAAMRIHPCTPWKPYPNVLRENIRQASKTCDKQAGINGTWQLCWSNTRGEAGTDKKTFVEIGGGRIEMRGGGRSLVGRFVQGPSANGGRTAVWRYSAGGRKYVHACTFSAANKPVSCNYEVQDPNRRPARYTGTYDFQTQNCAKPKKECWEVFHRHPKNPKWSNTPTTRAESAQELAQIKSDWTTPTHSYKSATAIWWEQITRWKKRGEPAVLGKRPCGSKIRPTEF